MKKKIIKLWGVGMIVVLMASLLMIGATPASAGTLAYSLQALPGGFNQVAGGTDVALVQVASNGDIYAVDSATPTDIYKSVDGGRTWGVFPVSLPAGNVIADLKISPSYETDGTVVVLANNAAGVSVFISENFGVTYAALGAQVAALPEVGTSLAISPVYNGGGQIMVGTSDPAIGAWGDVYIWGTVAAPYVWTAQVIGAGAEDVAAVAFSPSYQFDFTIIAVSSTAAGSFVRTKVAANAWDATVGIGAAATLATPTGALTAPGTAAGTDVASAVIATPSNFQANAYPTLAVLYVGVRSGNADDRIYRVLAGSGLAGVAMDPNQVGGFPAAGDDEVSSMDYIGDTATGSLIVGYAGVAGALTPAVQRCDNPGTALPTWSGAIKPPTGTLGAPAQNTYATFGADPTIIYAGTAGTNSALSVSVDGGLTYNQYGLIDTAVTTIDDIDAAGGGELYMVTNDATTLFASVWQSMDGLTWTRILSAVTGANAGIIELSPTYATDGTALFGNGLAGPNNLMLSTTSGSLWVPLTCGVVPADIAIKDSFTFYVGGVGGVDVTNNGGWTWQFPGPTAAAGAVVDLELNLTTGHILVANAAGGILRSINNNVSYIPLPVFGAVGVPSVAFDVNYGNGNNLVYIGDTGAPGIFSFDTGVIPAPPYVGIDGGLTSLTGDMVVTPDGVLYATDAAATGAGVDTIIGTADDTGGIVRILNPTAGLFAVAERIGIADGLVANGLTPGVLTAAEGSNILWAGCGVAVLTYTDTLTTAMPTQVAPADGSIVPSATAAVLSWEVPAGATSVDYQLSVRPDFIGAAIVNQTTIIGLAAPVALATPGTTYYWRIRVGTPVIGPWTGGWSFQSELVVALPNAPGIIPAAGGNGNTGPGGFNVPLAPTFQWTTVGAATGYEFRLATDPGMTDIIVDLTGPDALGTVTTYALTGITLEYSTTYYWQVRGISATSQTQWSAVNAFTTMDEVVETPPVIVTEQPPVTITVDIPTQPPDTTTQVVIEEKKISEGYIYAIIIIGAVLVIAVIILIVRTRRSV